MPTVRRETVAEQALSILRGKILGGVLRPGDPVTEEAMAKLIGVSRPTMREVLGMLVAEGLLTRHRTTRILQVATLTPTEVSEIYAARRLLEVAGLRAAAGLPAQAFAPLRATLTDMAAAIAARDVYAFVRADGQCHTETVALAANRYLTELHAGLMSKLNLILALVESVDPVDNAEVMHRHEEYVGFIVAGDLEEAEKQLVDRLQAAEQAVLRVFDSQGDIVARRRSLRPEAAPSRQT